MDSAANYSLSPTANTVQTPSKPPKKTLLILMPLVLVLLTFLVLLGIFIYQKITDTRYQVENLSQDWKQYTNYELKFQFKFPAIYEIYTNPDRLDKRDMQYTVDIGYNVKKNNALFLANILVFNDSMTNVSKYLHDQISYYISVDWKQNDFKLLTQNFSSLPPDSITSLTYSNIQEQIKTNALPIQKTYVLISHNNLTYVIVSDTKTINQVLNNFSFTDL